MAGCEICGGQHWYYAISADGKREELRRCGKCINLLAHSRLNKREQKSRISDIQNYGSPEIFGQLRMLGQEMLRDPFGWLTLYGGPGNAKSLLLTALVAEFCRQGTKAIYYHGKDLENGLFRDMHGETANREFYKRVPVLAIDEFSSINTNSQWVMDELFAILDHRYRNMDTQVTLLAMNGDPTIPPDDGGWCPDAWLSRMQDGRFNRHVDTGASERMIPGLLFVDAPDIRPALRR